MHTLNIYIVSNYVATYIATLQFHINRNIHIRGGGTGPADPAAAGPIIYSDITTKDESHNLTEELQYFL